MAGATEEHIARAEDALGQRLPEAVRARLKRHNGGDIVVADYPSDERTWELLPVFEDSGRERARRTSGHIVAATEEARIDDGFPADGVVLADNGTGDLLVAVGDDVLWWDHETAELHPAEVEL